MNNGKVRIYELSKELDLDNKDILNVCADLNISAKSHSSTITENEAERIRAAAVKYASSHSSSGKSQVTGHGTASQKEPPKPVVKKQQILGIRRPSPSQAAGSGSSPVNANDVPSSPNPPVTAFSPPSQSSTRPVLPSRPVRPTPVAPASSHDEELPPMEEPLEVEVEAVAQVVEELAEPATTPVQVENPPQRPSLVEPPARSIAANDSSPRSVSNRPVLKVARQTGGQPATPEKSSAGERVARSSAPGAPPGERVPVRRPSAPDGGSQGPSKSSDVPELKRPPQLLQPPVLRPPRRREDVAKERDGEARVETATGVPPGVGEPDEFKQHRPGGPLRPPKRSKDREDDDEELQDFPAKAPKAGAKTKRRGTSSLDDEFEEDFSESGLNIPEPVVQVSLSLARPPKPKNRPGQAKPTAAPTMAPRAKRPSSGESTRNRRERREEVKTERPEKIALTGSLTVQELASLLVVPETDLIKALFFKGIAANIYQTLDLPSAKMLAEELGVEVETVEKTSEARKVTEMLDAGDLEKLQRRPPVVTIMGHVDHGKTTLLDSIRKTKVAQGEAGGITQHIGAYHVDVEHAETLQQVVFLDTPGHQAFTAMRARGARVTDVAILVVAADDGVQPQTIEAISHAKAAEVPIIVAINKIDKESAQPDRVKQELTEFGLVAEEWGGDTVMVPVSAMTGDNLDTLLEMILLVAEVEDLYANPDRPAKGTVIEAHLDKARGPVATLLVQNGTLRVGDILVVGSCLGKVRAMVDDRGKRVEAAGPSFAVEVLGLNEVPSAGDEFDVFSEEKDARALATERLEQQRNSRLQQRAMSARQVTLSSLSAKAQEGELKELNLILKADVQGSVEAILGALQQIPQNEVQLRILLSAPGEVTETDVDLAAASGAVILGFNTTLASGTRHAADQTGVDIREYNIIYKLLDDVQGAMEGLLEPELVEEPLGQVEVRAVFTVGKGSVAGCYVLSGKAIRNCNLRVRRGGQVVYEGILDSLKRVKDDVKEVNAGYECGIGLGSFNDWTLGDIIETFRMVTKRRTLSPA
ncbi:MAG: translation initiation factor IF-2 [Leptolyngbyaceae cyanobacterium bins.59]|nr:translation initiation factor IF-2 [Leptolyngbyaceae cyanobacterium bins.59]